MKHFASPEFWERYELLPEPIKRLADRNFERLKNVRRIHRSTSSAPAAIGRPASACITGPWQFPTVKI